VTDRLKGVYVTFDKDYRTDDAEQIIEAIKMIKCVSDVKGLVVDHEDWMNRARVKDEMRDKFFELWKSFADSK